MCFFLSPVIGYMLTVVCERPRFSLADIPTEGTRQGINLGGKKKREKKGKKINETAPPSGRTLELSVG